MSATRWQVAKFRLAGITASHLTCFSATPFAGTDIGIVTAIAAPAALEVKFFGDGGHAGALLMPFR